MSEHNYTPEDRDAALERIRKEIMRRIREGDVNLPEFYRPAKRNFFEDSRRKQFAAACHLGENFLLVPIEFAIVGDDKTAYKVDEDELLAILTKEHLWDISMPEWMQQGTTLDLNAEDDILLREFQLFKSC